jgi:GGDEF domain-containing protein
MTSHDRKPFRLLLLMAWSILNAFFADLLAFSPLVLTCLFCGFLAICTLAISGIQEKWWYNRDLKLGLSALCYLIWLTPWPEAEPWLSLTSWIWILVFVDECRSFHYRILVIFATLTNSILTLVHFPNDQAFYLLYVHASLAPIAIYMNLYLLEEHRRIAENASIEPLSGAYSEAHLRRRLYQEISRSRYTDRALSILIFKVEDFDLYEEGLATRVIKQFLNAYRVSITTQIRAGDEVYYLGHGDFLLLVPNCNAEGSLVLKERLARQLESRSWPVLGAIHLIVGFATQQDSENAADLLARARHQLNKQQQTALRLVAFADG